MLVATIAGIAIAAAPYPPPPGTKNLLVIVTDDLRPWFSPYTHDGVEAPNLSKLATDGMVFNHTFVQQAVCSPSRNSFMTSRRADSTGVWNFRESFRTAGIDRSGAVGTSWIPWPEALKRSGFNVLGLGKVYHPQWPKDNDCLDPDSGDCRSWSTSFESTKPATVFNHMQHGAHVINCTTTTTPARCDFRYAGVPGQIFWNETRDGAAWAATAKDLPDAQCTDYQLADIAAATLPVVAADPHRPFALFVGFHKPHPFWDVPQRFQDKYTNLPLPTHRDAPANMPDVAFYSCKSLGSRSEFGGINCANATLNNQHGAGGNCSYIVPNSSYAWTHGRLHRPSDELQRYVRAGYAGGLTWADEQIGKVLDTLDAIGKRNDTLVIFFADQYGCLCLLCLLLLLGVVGVVFRVDAVSVQ